jgi:hypothetical protein
MYIDFICSHLLIDCSSSFSDDDTSLTIASGTLGTLLQRSRSSRSRKPLSIRAAMQQSVTYTNLSRSGSVSQSTPQSINASHRQSAILIPLPAVPTPPPSSQQQVSAMTADLYDGATAATASRKPISDKARRKRPAFLALHSEDLEHATETARYAQTRRERDQMRRSSPTVGENFTFLEAASDVGDRAMPEDARYLNNGNHPTARREVRNGAGRIGLHTTEFSSLADEDYDLEEHLEDPPVPPPAKQEPSRPEPLGDQQLVYQGRGDLQLGDERLGEEDSILEVSHSPDTPRSPKLDPIREESDPQPKRQKSSSSVRSQIIALPETARLRKQASGELARQQQRDQLDAPPSVPSVKVHPSPYPPRSSSSLDGLANRRASDMMHKHQSSDPSHLTLRQRRTPHRSASTDARSPHPTIPLPPPPDRVRKQFGFAPSATPLEVITPTSATSMIFSPGSPTASTPAEQDTWPLTTEMAQNPPSRQPQAQPVNQGEGPSFPALRTFSPDNTPRPSRSATPLFSNAPYPSTPRTNRSRSNTGMTLPEGNEKTSIDDGSSVSGSLAPSVISAQWYRSPQERLGLGSRISRIVDVQWDEMGQSEEKSEEAAKEDRGKTPSRNRKLQLFPVFPMRSPSRTSKEDTTPEPPPKAPRSPLLTEKFLSNVKGLPEDPPRQIPVPERSQSVRAASDKRTLASRDGSDVSELPSPKSKESRFHNLGELVTEYKSMANKWYTSQYHEVGDASTRPSTGSASLHSSALNEMVFQQPDIKTKTLAPRPSKESNSTTSTSTGKSTSEKSSKSKTKKKKPSLFTEMVSEYKSLSKNWYTDDDEEQRSGTASTRRSTSFT